MRRTFGVLAGVLLVSAPAWADVTLTLQDDRQDGRR